MISETIILQILILIGGLAAGYYAVRQQAIKTNADQEKADKQFELEVQRIAKEMMDRQQKRIGELESRLDQVEKQAEYERAERRKAESRLISVENQLANEKLERQRAEALAISLKKSLEESTIARNDRLQRIAELEQELEQLRARLLKVEKRDTGPLKGEVKP